MYIGLWLCLGLFSNGGFSAIRGFWFHDLPIMLQMIKKDSKAKENGTPYSVIPLTPCSFDLPPLFFEEQVPPPARKSTIKAKIPSLHYPQLGSWAIHPTVRHQPSPVLSTSDHNQ